LIHREYARHHQGSLASLAHPHIGRLQDFQSFVQVNSVGLAQVKRIADEQLGKHQRLRLDALVLTPSPLHLVLPPGQKQPAPSEEGANTN